MHDWNNIRKQLVAGARGIGKLSPDTVKGYAMAVAVRLRCDGCIAVVFLRIGALKLAAYESDGIMPFVADSPLMSFFYDRPKGRPSEHMRF